MRLFSQARCSAKNIFKVFEQILQLAFCRFIKSSLIKGLRHLWLRTLLTLSQTCLLQLQYLPLPIRMHLVCAMSSSYRCETVIFCCASPTGPHCMKLVRSARSLSTVLSIVHSDLQCLLEVISTPGPPLAKSSPWHSSHT